MDKRPCLQTSLHDEQECANDVYERRESEAVRKQKSPQFVREQDNGKPDDEGKDVR